MQDTQPTSQSTELTKKDLILSRVFTLLLDPSKSPEEISAKAKEITDEIMKIIDAGENEEWGENVM